MAREEKDWNYDRIHSALSVMNDAQADMMRCLYRGAVNDVVQERMIQRLNLAIEQMEKLRIDNSQ